METEVKLKELIATKKPKVGAVLFIAVDGHGGSGKSTLAQKLSEMLKAEIVHTDDFASWDNPRNWSRLVMEQVFKPIQNGATSLSYPRSKWWENHHPEPVLNQRVTPRMILEGVGPLRKEFRDYISAGFFVDTSNEICLQRGIERDLSTGKPLEELTAMWNAWHEEECAYIKKDDPKAYADAVIDGTKPIEDQVV